MLQKDLEAKGFVIFTATNGHTAVHLAKKNIPDVILLDVVMPMASGLRVFEILRQSPETSKIPVIFLTGLKSSDVYPTVEQGTHVAYLKKPVDIDDLVSLIQQFLPKS